MTKSDKRVIEANEFVLKGEAGQTLAVLGHEPKGGATLRFFDQKSTRRCVVGVSAQGTPMVSLGDADEKPCVCITETDEGAQVQIRDKESQMRACIGINTTCNHAYIKLGSPEGKNQFLLFANEDGSTSVILHNAQDTPVLGLRVHQDGTPAILVQDMGNVLDGLPSTRFPDKFDFASQSAQEVADGGDEVPSDDRMVETPEQKGRHMRSFPHGEPDAWHKTGIVFDD